LTFRKATPDDLEAVLLVIARADAAAGDAAPPPGAEGDRERVIELLAAGDDHNQVAETEGRVVGYANLHERGGTGHLSYLFVDPDWQGQGIGRRLMERALDEARRRGYRQATLATAVQNAAARRFYERTGWKDTGGRSHHERLGLDMADYALDLEGPRTGGPRPGR
jgi:ribosomal protein S18 acetylase RimI-like enzyme